MSDERNNLSGPTGAPWQLALDRESSIFPDFMDGSPLDLLPTFRWSFLALLTSSKRVPCLITDKRYTFLALLTSSKRVPCLITDKRYTFLALRSASPPDLKGEETEINRVVLEERLGVTGSYFRN